MRNLAIPIEDASFAELAAVSRAAGLTPVEFARRATASAVRLLKSRDAAGRDAAGYASQPVGDEEFAVDPDDLQRGVDETW